MATETIIFFDSRINAEELCELPRRLLAKCPRFAQFFAEWGWELDPGRYEWSSGDYRDWERPFDLQRAGELWSRGVDVKLFGPGGHFYLRPRSLDWHSETKWSWFIEGGLARDDFLTAASQLGTLSGASFGLISPDGGSEDPVLDLLEAGKDVSESADVLRSAGMPLDRVAIGEALPVTPAPYFFSVGSA